MDDNKIVQRNRLLNQATHHFESVLSKRMFYIIEAQIVKQYGIQLDLVHDLWFRIPTNLLGNQHGKDLHKACKELLKSHFDFHDENYSNFTGVNPFTMYRYRERNGFVEVKMEVEALKYLAELKYGYSKYKLHAALSLNSGYAQRWYELFCERKNNGIWRNVTKEQIAELHKIDINSFKRTADFFKVVIYRPLEELNAKTEITIESNPMLNQKRPIIGFDFTITSKNVVVKNKVDEFLDRFSKMDPMEVAKIANEIITKYRLSEALYAEIFNDFDFLATVMEVHFKLEEGTLKPKTTPEKYMAGVIKNFNQQKG